MLDPVVLDDDLARAEPPECLRPVDLERQDRVIHRDCSDRQVVALRIGDPDPDLAGVELDAADVELVDRRRVLAEQTGDGRPARREERHDAGQQDQRHERPEPPAAPRANSCGGLGHQSVTLKKPIQPSSANSDWCAWNMNRPLLAKSISMIPRWPCDWTTVSVYSKWSPVPVG